MEILEESEAFPSALPARREVDHAAWVTIQIGCDNTCAFCIVPAVRGKEQSRRLGDIVHEVEALAADGVTEITLLGQNVNSYGRDLGAGQYRPLFADLLRAVDAVPGIRRVRFTSPHPKDLRPETIAAMAECPSVCEHLHLPLQAGSDRTLARMHRGYTGERYLERLAAARAGIADLAVTTDLIVGFPGETDADFAETLAVVDEAGYDAAYTFVFSPRPGTEAAAWTDDFLPSEVTAERMSRLTEVVERHALVRHEARVGRTEEVLVEGPSKKDPTLTTGRTRQNKLVHFAADGLPPGRLRRSRASTAPPPTSCGARCAAHRRSRPGPVPAWWSTPFDGASGPGRCRPPPARPHWPWPPPAPSGDVEIVSVDSMQVYRGMDIGTAKATPAERAEVPHHLIDLADPVRGLLGGPVPGRRRARRSTTSRARGRRALLVGGTGLYYQAVVDRLDAARATTRRCGPSSRPAVANRAGSTRSTRELAERDPVAAGRIDPGNQRRIVRALEVTLATGRPFSSFGPGLFASTRRRCAVAGGRVDAPGRPAAADRRPVRRHARARAWSTRSAAWPPPRRAVPHRPARPSATRRSCDQPRGTHPVEAALSRAADRTRQLARRQRMWFRRDPRIAWLGTANNPLAALPALLARWTGP